MKFREMPDAITEVEAQTGDATPLEVVGLLRNFEVGECWRKRFIIYDNPSDTSALMHYINALQRAGLDIGGGDSEFGYKMPIPPKGAGERELVIFKRR